MSELYKAPSSNCWLPRNMRRKGLGSRASQTPGSAKDWNCKKEPNSSYMSKRNRSWKHPDYAEWSARHRGGKHPYTKY